MHINIPGMNRIIDLFYPVLARHSLCSVCKKSVLEIPLLCVCSLSQLSMNYGNPIVSY